MTTTGQWPSAENIDFYELKKIKEEDIEEDDEQESNWFKQQVFGKRGFLTGGMLGSMEHEEEFNYETGEEYEDVSDTQKVDNLQATDAEILKRYKSMSAEIKKLIFVNEDGLWSYFEEEPGLQYWRYHFVSDLMDLTMVLVKEKLKPEEHEDPTIHNEGPRQTLYDMTRDLVQFWLNTVTTDASDELKEAWNDTQDGNKRRIVPLDELIDKKEILGVLNGLIKYLKRERMTTLQSIVEVAASRVRNSSRDEHVQAEEEDLGEEEADLMEAGTDDEEDLNTEQPYSEAGTDEDLITQIDQSQSHFNGVIHDHGLDMQQQSSVPPPNPQPLHHVPAPVHQPPKAHGIKKPIPNTFPPRARGIKKPIPNTFPPRARGIKKRRTFPPRASGIKKRRHDPELQRLDLSRDPENTILTLRR